MDAAHELRETMHMGRLDGTQIVYLLTVESHEYRRSNHRVGRRLEAIHTALGKAVLSTRPDTALGSLPEPLTPGSLTSLKAARADLELTRTRGYATDNEENTPGLRCFGVALRYSTPVRDSISCSIPIERLTPARERTIIDTLLTIRERIEWSAPVDAVR